MKDETQSGAAGPDAPPLSELVRVAVKLQRAVETTGLPFCVIGGLAVQRCSGGASRG